MKLQTNEENIINIKCTYRFRNNQNVTDQISILTDALGAETVSFPQEPTTSQGISAYAAEVADARRIRRIQMQNGVANG